MQSSTGSSICVMASHYSRTPYQRQRQAMGIAASGHRVALRLEGPRNPKRTTWTQIAQTGQCGYQLLCGSYAGSHRHHLEWFGSAGWTAFGMEIRHRSPPTLPA